MNIRVDTNIVATAHSSEEQFQEEQPIAYRRYLLSTLIAVIVLLSSTATFNYLVDPYLRFGSPRVEGFNALKPAAIKQVKMAKAYQACRRQYKTILLGNSRVDVGLNPESDAFPAQWRPVYNLGQPGTGSEAALLYLEHVLAHYEPTNIVLAVDFLNYLENPNQDAVDLAHRAKASPEILRLSSIHENDRGFRHTQQCVRDVLAAELSLTALVDSVRTVAAQINPRSANITDDGFNTAQAFHDLIRTEGQAALFEQKNQEYVEKLSRQIAPSLDSSSEIDAIAAILDLCRNRRIAAKLYIHPYHADVLNIIKRTGHWHELESWKHDLANLCDRQHVELWDFSQESSVTVEPVPPSNDRQTVMKGYWESGHYRDTTGDLVLARMFGDTRVSDFGTLVSQY